jgi:hypothetical protein
MLQGPEDMPAPFEWFFGELRISYSLTIFSNFGNPFTVLVKKSLVFCTKDHG